MFVLFEANNNMTVRFLESKLNFDLDKPVFVLIFIKNEQNSSLFAGILTEKK